MASVRPIVLAGLAAALAGPAPALHAQTPATCAETADSLAAFLGRNYVALRMDTTAGGPADALRRRAVTGGGRPLDATACYLALRGWVDGFRDGHLFLLESTRVDSAETARRAGAVRRLALDEGELRRRLGGAGARDPLEGIWFDRGLRVGVVPDPDGPGDAFVAVVLQPDTAGWAPGAVRARFTRRPDGGYDAELAERNHARRHLVARLHRGVLLRMPPHMWGREAPEPRGEALDSLDPRRPSVRTEGRAVVMAVPSFDPERAGSLPRLLRDWHERILAADPFVIDLRGNEGGSSLAARPLLRYTWAEPERPAAYPAWQPMLLASAEHLAWLRSLLPADREVPPWVTRLQGRMEASPGAVVPYLLPEELPPRWRPDTAYAAPARVLVVVDGGVMSAGESFVLEAMRSPRVTLSGQPKAGVHDYQNTRIVAVGRGDFRYLLGYPTIAGHPRFPDGGINRTGIRPARPFPVGEGEGWER